MEATYDYLRKIQLEEKHKASLFPIESDFYSSFKSRIGQLEERLSTDPSFDGAKEQENTLKILRDVIDRRQKKILLKAQHDLLAGEVSSEGLAEEEKELYRSIIKLLKEHESVVLNGSAQTALAEQAPAPEEQEPELLSIKILQDLPEFVGPDMQVCGPFKQDQVVQLEKEEALLLINRNAAQQVE